MRVESGDDAQRDDKLLFRNEIFNLVGACIEVLNEVGHGYHEKPYENALVVECGLRGIPIQQQRKFDLTYKGEHIGEFIPDLIAHDAIIIDTKVIPKITDRERGQMLNYLKATGLRVGLIVNFQHRKLEWERLVR